MNRPAQFAPPFVALGFTAAEYLRLLASGGLTDIRTELVRGEIVKMMPSYLAHGEAHLTIGARLMQAYGGSARIAADLMIAIGPDTIRAADIAVVRPDAPRDRPVDPADLLLVVEIASTSLVEDMGAKLADYAAAGIADYWVVDLEGGVTHVMAEPGDGRYAQRRIARFGEPVAVPGTDATIVVD